MGKKVSLNPPRENKTKSFERRWEAVEAVHLLDNSD
jgi:hypothetical protein